MALQLGALRDALIDAGAAPEKAAAASEEMAGYDNRLTHLTTLVQILLGLVVITLGSQAALWSEYGKLSGKVDALTVQVAAMNQKLDEIARAVANR